VSLVALAEFIWVMTRTFRVDRAGIHTILNELLARQEIVLEQADIVYQAASLFWRGSADFTDYLVACAARAAGCNQTLTFDRKAAKSAGMTLIASITKT
jgi:predicted nucleic-acid-binding protein